MNPLLAQPMAVRIDVHYRRDASEHYELVVMPLATDAMAVRLRMPHAPETECRVRAWPAQLRESQTERVVHAVVACFFGDVHAVPRIVGAPDWRQVTLDVRLARDDLRRRPSLLHVDLVVQTPTRATLTRSDGAHWLRDDAVRLCREDADAVYAITRVALTRNVMNVPEETADEQMLLSAAVPIVRAPAAAHQPMAA